jgi:hypothetical protein
MIDLTTPLPFAAALTTALALVSAAGLRAWRQWLDLKRSELVRDGRTTPRGDLGELKRRVRRLEALASGIEI